MLYKQIIPQASDFGGQEPIQILNFSSKGLDKTASMRKRASAFQDVLAEIKPMPKKAYLHVITTGAGQYYGQNRNRDYWNEKKMVIDPPLAKNASCKHIVTDQGLSKYHETYLDGAAVYQEHKTNRDGVKPSGIVKAAKYNYPMHRGQLLIQVDTDKWRDRLQKHASGQNIFLSVGAQMDSDLCPVCGNRAKTLKQHCDHVTKMAGMVLDDGTKCCMINDAPKFYDISGVNVPADQMAFVMRKIASGSSALDAIQTARYSLATRKGMGFSKAAGILSKLSAIQKQLDCKMEDDPIFTDDDQAVKDFLSSVENYPTDQIISQCNNKAILLSPEMLFKLLGKESDNRELFEAGAQNCPVCGKHLMQQMQDDPQFQNQLYDGSFDQNLPVDINLSSILDKFIGDFGVSRPAVNRRSIKIIIMGEGKPRKEDKQQEPQKVIQKATEDNQKSDSQQHQEMQKEASALNNYMKQTYARYVISFAQKNNDDTCMLAMQKLARYK